MLRRHGLAESAGAGAAAALAVATQPAAEVALAAPACAPGHPPCLSKRLVLSRIHSGLPPATGLGGQARPLAAAADSAPCPRSLLRQQSARAPWAEPRSPPSRSQHSQPKLAAGVRQAETVPPQGCWHPRDQKACPRRCEQLPPHCPLPALLWRSGQSTAECGPRRGVRKAHLRSRNNSVATNDTPSQATPQRGVI